MEFMEALSQYGWTVYYFAGLCTGVILSLFAGLLSTIAECLLDTYLDHKELKRQIKALDKAREEVEKCKKEIKV